MANTSSKILSTRRDCDIHLKLLEKKKIPFLFAQGNKVNSLKTVPGVSIISKEKGNKMEINLKILKGVKLKNPIFFCFAIFQERGIQKISARLILEERSQAKLLTNCVFPKAESVFHKMEMDIILKRRAKLIFLENHYHGEKKGAKVRPILRVKMGEKSYFQSEFLATQGKIGDLNIFSEVFGGKESSGDILTKVVGRGKGDRITISDNFYLIGENSKGMIKTRGVSMGGAKIFFQGEVIAEEKAKFAKGHMDCQEIVIGDHSLAKSVPSIEVRNPEARITHEASVGKISQRELEVLMTRGLSEKEAIEFIIKGIMSNI